MPSYAMATTTVSRATRSQSGCSIGLEPLSRRGHASWASPRMPGDGEHPTTLACAASWPSGRSTTRRGCSAARRRQCDAAHASLDSHVPADPRLHTPAPAGLRVRTTSSRCTPPPTLHCSPPCWAARTGRSCLDYDTSDFGPDAGGHPIIRLRLKAGSRPARAHLSPASFATAGLTLCTGSRIGSDDPSAMLSRALELSVARRPPACHTVGCPPAEAEAVAAAYTNGESGPT